MKPIVHIPQPCHEDWNVMQPNAQGRHCAQCSKTVVDFTAWANEDILCYLQKNAGNKICGRFTTAQAVKELPKLEATPEAVALYVQLSPLSFLQRIAAIVLISIGVLLTGCEKPEHPSYAGAIAAQRANPVLALQQHETALRNHEILGGIRPVHTPPPPAETQQSTHKDNKTAEVLQPGEPKILTGAPMEYPHTILQDTPQKPPVPILDPQTRHTMGDVEGVMTIDTLVQKPERHPRRFMKGKVASPRQEQ